ncbi:prolipoprotein diacylglyceryl transferase [Acidimangrovimonas sediminis]|uniref:prolipoprotein diacylglyceryl transferase n=1 Tax=Acidimangrovimonas sediminis TaxID=2056283 RepID=UPI000C7FE256|nr:prolipoprotein diacylglyceryl transferase [Acidimangrovimonas sediminis]
MQHYIPFPDISPDIFTLHLFGATFSLRWYAVAYIVGLITGWRIVVALVKRAHLWPGGTAPMSPRQVEDLLTWVILGVVLGGRIGFVLFYEPAYYFSHPWEIPQVWNGGMSFHGGFLGVMIAGLIYTWRQGIPFFQVADAMAVATPPGLMFGRIANFINDELWGLPSHVPWAVAFPGPEASNCGPGWVGVCTRHPSQLYEAGMEGILLGSLLLYLAWRTGALKRTGRVLGVFLIGYGLARFTVEFFRQADPEFMTPSDPMGNVIRFGHGLGGFSMGQVLSLPMILIGLGFLWWSFRRRPESGPETRPETAPPAAASAPPPPDGKDRT